MLKLRSYDMYEKSIHRNLESNIFQNLQQFNVYQTFANLQLQASDRPRLSKNTWTCSAGHCRAMSKHLSTPLVWYDSCQPLSRLQCWKKCGEDGGWFLRMYNSIRKCMLLDYNSALWIYTKTSKYWIVQNVPCFIPFFFSPSQCLEDGLHFPIWKGLTLDCTAQLRYSIKWSHIEGHFRQSSMSNEKSMHSIHSMWLNHKLPQASEFMVATRHTASHLDRVP